MLNVAQYVEYKLSFNISKGAESLWGFVTILPGAFSLFKWAAVQGEPLDLFFGNYKHGQMTCSEANMLLAEDKMICIELLAKSHSAWLIRYIPECKAITDAPLTLASLFKQRRRWMNGGIFAGVYCVRNFCRVNKTNHAWWRIFVFYFVFIYYIMDMILQLLL